VLPRRKIIGFLLLLATVLLTVAGCGKQSAADTKPQPTIGILDVNKAIKAHRQYGAVEQLQQEVNMLTRQLAAEQSQKTTVTAPGTNLAAAGAAELNSAADQEFSAKMAAKQAEFNTQLDARAEQIRQLQAPQLDAYTQEIDKEYQPQIFNLQLKLKTVKLTKEEAAAVQQQLEKIQAERAAKLKAKQQQLAKNLDEVMAAEHAKYAQQLTAYRETLQTQMQQQLAAQQSQLNARLVPSTVSQADPGTTNATAQQLAVKRQQLNDLQQQIIKDTEDTVARIAAERGLTTVLTKVRVNVSAVDLTDAVIAEFKK
jgi:hypothetical protein